MAGLDDYLRHPKHGPLPMLLIVLTFGTGVIDATSILGLGRVFVANMTGNVVFIGFALAGAPGYSVWGSLVALAGFLGGASGGGALIARSSTNRAVLLRNSLAIQSFLFAAALVAAIAGLVGVKDGVADSGGLPLLEQVVVLGCAALALGLQNAVVRQLAVPDMTTTVLTMTLTGIGSDLRKGDRATALRRVVAVVAMLVGAVVGALLVLGLGVVAGLALALAVLFIALGGAAASARASAPWQAA